MGTKWNIKFSNEVLALAAKAKLFEEGKMKVKGSLSGEWNHGNKKTVAEADLGVKNVEMGDAVGCFHFNAK